MQPEYMAYGIPRIRAWPIGVGLRLCEARHHEISIWNTALGTNWQIDRFNKSASFRRESCRLTLDQSK